MGIKSVLVISRLIHGNISDSKIPWELSYQLMGTTGFLVTSNLPSRKEEKKKRKVIILKEHAISWKELEALLNHFWSSVLVIANLRHELWISICFFLKNNLHNQMLRSLIVQINEILPSEDSLSFSSSYFFRYHSMSISLSTVHSALCRIRFVLLRYYVTVSYQFSITMVVLFCNWNLYRRKKIEISRSSI